MKALGAMTMLVGYLFMPASMASPQQCTRSQAIQAETQADTLKTWAEVFASYQHYKQCDDGAIAEGYSDSIAKLLSAHWDQIGELAKLSTIDAGFERFVVRHIDELMTPDQYSVIRQQVTSSCPANASRLCTKMKKRVADLDAESKQ